MAQHSYRWIIAICLLVFLAGCAGPQVSPGFPVYKGSKEYSAPSQYYQLLGIPTHGVTVKTYFVEGGNAKDILNWYRNELPRNGYEIAQEPVFQTLSTPQGSFEWGMIVGKKGEIGVGIWAMSFVAEGKRGTMYYVVEGKIQDLAPSKTPSQVGEKLPSSDQARGEEPIPRYPNSVMLSYSKSEGFPTIIIIDYGTKDSFQAVAEWYKRDLQSRGWKVKDEKVDAERASLHFVKAQEEVGVIVYAPTSEKGYTLISIHYGVYRLPSKDVASGSEPVQRYPGSVMLKYSSMTYMGLRILFITYGTHDSVDRVASWYEGYLKQNGWQIVTTSAEDGTRSITSLKENAMISVVISPKTGYTEIEVTYQGEYRGS